MSIPLFQMYFFNKPLLNLQKLIYEPFLVPLLAVLNARLLVLMRGSLFD